MSSRTITITVCDDYCGTVDVKRKMINDFFLPKNTFKFYITYKNTSVWCECEIDTYDLPTDNIYATQSLVISVFCPNPYFKSIDNFGKDLSEITPKMGFPLLIPKNKGFISSVRNFSKSVWISNDGAVDVHCKAVITLDSFVENFKLYKNEHEYILFPKFLNKGDVVEIDFEKKKILINGISSLNRIDRASSFFSIDRGGCYISYSTDANENKVHVIIYYNKLYMGV